MNQLRRRDLPDGATEASDPTSSTRPIAMLCSLAGGNFIWPVRRTRLKAFGIGGDQVVVAPDWAYDAASWFQRFMDGMSDPRDLVVGMALSLAATPLLILVHEIGHAVAVHARGLPLRQLKVGHASDFSLEVGPLRVELGRLTGASPVGGFVAYENGRASPMDVLVIALAGPAASLGGAIVTGSLANAWWGHGQLTVVLVLTTLEGGLDDRREFAPSGIAFWACSVYGRPMGAACACRVAPREAVGRCTP